MTITAIVENDTIKLPPGVHVPDGTPARVVLEKPSGRTLADRYAGLVGIIKDGPEDSAVEHDHYAHGAPKRAGQ